MAKIVEITEKNWEKYRPFLMSAMCSEFPKDEQLTEEAVYMRVKNEEKFDGLALYLVNVIETESPIGFITCHRRPTTGSPTSLIAYAALVENHKSKGYGSMLFDSVKDGLLRDGIEDIVLETEPVPRVVTHAVHDDLSGCYKREGDSLIFTRGNLAKQFEGIDRRNTFWERNGFAIIHDLPYCQPNLDPEAKESYVGEKRVPLDLQFMSLIDNSTRIIPIDRLQQILTAFARPFYESSDDLQEFVELLLRKSHSGLHVNEFSALPYSELLKAPSVMKAYQSLGLQSRYDSKG